MIHESLLSITRVLSCGDPAAEEAYEAANDTPDDDENDDQYDTAGGRTCATTTAGITAGIVGNVVDNKADNVHQETGDKTRQKGQPPLYRHPAHDKAGDETDEHANKKREYAVAKNGKGERILRCRVFCYLIGMIGRSICQRNDDTLADTQHTGDNSGKQAIFQAIERQPGRGDALPRGGRGSARGGRSARRGRDKLGPYFILVILAGRKIVGRAMMPVLARLVQRVIALRVLHNATLFQLFRVSSF
jgi:hypothetical protein